MVSVYYKTCSTKTLWRTTCINKGYSFISFTRFTNAHAQQTRLPDRLVIGGWRLASQRRLAEQKLPLVQTATRGHAAAFPRLFDSWVSPAHSRRGREHQRPRWDQEHIHILAAWTQPVWTTLGWAVVGLDWTELNHALLKPIKLNQSYGETDYSRRIESIVEWV